MENGGRRIVVDLAVEAGAPNRIRGLGLAPEADVLPAPRALTAAQAREVVDSTGRHGEPFSASSASPRETWLSAGA